LLLATGQTQRNVEVTPWLWENMTEAIEALRPGKHTLRIARLLNGQGHSSKDPPQIRVVSQAVTIEIVETDAANGTKLRRPVNFPSEIRLILQSLKQDVLKLSQEYPQLAGAEAMEVTAATWERGATSIPARFRLQSACGS
jgi:hypothetical protein